MSPFSIQLYFFRVISFLISSLSRYLGNTSSHNYLSQHDYPYPVYRYPWQCCLSIMYLAFHEVYALFRCHIPCMALTSLVMASIRPFHSKQSIYVMLLKIFFFYLLMYSSSIFIHSALIRITRSFLVNEFTELHTGTLNVKRSTWRVTHHKVDQQLVSRWNQTT